MVKLEAHNKITDIWNILYVTIINQNIPSYFRNGLPLRRVTYLLDTQMYHVYSNKL